MSMLNELTEAVKVNTSLIGSAIQAFNGIADRMEAAHNAKDDAAITALIEEIRASDAALAAAVAANTPAEPVAEMPAIVESAPATEEQPGA